MSAKRVLARTALVLAGLAIGLKIADLVVGRIDPAGISHFANHNRFYTTCVERRQLPPGGFEMDFAIAGTRAEANVVYQINRLGFRGREYSLEKPSDAHRIVVLGDSVTFGWGVALEERFTDLVERALNAEGRSGKAIEILNLALPGYETMHHRYVFNQIWQYGPDAVVVCFNRNDVQNDTAESINLQFLGRGRIDEVGWRARIFVDDPWKSVLEATVPNLRLLGVHRYIYSLRENDGDYLADLYAKMKNGIDISVKLLADMHGVCAKRGVPFGVADLHFVKPIEAGLLAANVPYRTIGYRDDVTNMSLRNSAVDPHPNAEGHAILAKNFEAALDEFGMVPREDR